MSIKIYHNPRCRKSRETLELIKKNGEEPEIVEYLKTPPTQDELSLLLARLNISPLELIRKEEKLFKQEYKNLNFTDDEWITVMVENPILIQRPIVVKGSKAILGRPPENVLKLL